ncbi:hypothetical protein ACRALDRAFT_2045704, partial [Sodiomyces alcalophilus JCM 7366]|uniref:uncharacterized protein n=1 Tax=Sodiomyces alcalophilus JCM 7366 TaxID=591952 RepID=UPI0039B5634A
QPTCNQHSLRRKTRRRHDHKSTTLDKTLSFSVLLDLPWQTIRLACFECASDGKRRGRAARPPPRRLNAVLPLTAPITHAFDVQFLRFSPSFSSPSLQTRLDLDYSSAIDPDWISARASDIPTTSLLFFFPRPQNLRHPT